eukprot:COSAG03_NODE_808_length_5767_cov_6.385850_6_plen_43_part_00
MLQAEQNCDAVQDAPNNFRTGIDAHPVVMDPSMTFVIQGVPS